MESGGLMKEAGPEELGWSPSGEAMDGVDAVEATGVTDSVEAASAPVKRSGEFALVPRGGSFDGQVAIVGPTRIEGHIRGSLRGPGELYVGAEARVEGRVECEALESEGEIVGPVAVRTRARFGAGARLDGDLQVPVVAFDDDAIWNGRAQIGDDTGPEVIPDESGESS